MAVNRNVAGAVAIYDPNGPAAIIAFLAFAAVTVALFTRYFRTRPRARWMRILLVGCFFTSLGYICRFSRRNGISAWSWLFESLFILLSPCAFLAQIYLILPKIARHLDAEASLPVGRRTLVVGFVLADLTTVLSQLAGTALTITFGNLVHIGQIILTASLWVQLACFSCFIAIYVTFGLRMKKRGAFEADKSFPRSQRWSTLYRAMGVSCVLLLIRSIYRVAEYTAGPSSGFGQSEAAFYVLDTVMMLFNVILFAVVWPPQCLEKFEELPMHSVGK